MCDYPWSNRDLFQYVNGCHIYIPMWTFFMSLNIVFALIAWLYSIFVFVRSSRKDMPLLCITNEFLFILSYLWCLGGNASFVTGNYLLNIFYGISRGGLYIMLNIFTLRSVEVLLVMDKIKLGHDKTLNFLRFLMTHVILFISLPIDVLAVTLPITLEFSMATAVLSALLILATINAPVSWFYLWKLKKNLSLMVTSRDLYDSVDKKIFETIKCRYFLLYTWCINCDINFIYSNLSSKYVYCMEYSYVNHTFIYDSICLCDSSRYWYK